MNATIFSLLSLVLAFALLVGWVFSRRTRQRWEEASQLPFLTDDDNSDCQRSELES